MRWMDAVRFSVGNLRKNPMRTLLTILGLGVGIGAVLTVLTLGSAGEEQVERQIARLGVDKVWVTPAEGSDLSKESADQIRQAVGAEVCAGGHTAAVVMLGEKAAGVQISGYDEGMTAVHALEAAEGRLFAPREHQGAAVAVVDRSLADALGGDVVGKQMDIGSRRVRIIGIVETMKVQTGTAAGGMVILPLKTFQDTYEKIPISEMTVNVPRGRSTDWVIDRVKKVLGEEAETSSLQTEIEAARAVVRIFVMVLTCVAAVCMLTGGIGVMNILLVSVRERRREIGLIKAIGGTSRQVAGLFLLEAAGYAALGGLLGVALGMGMIWGFGSWIGLQAALRVGTALPVMAAACLLGAAFGVLPALRAAGLAPVDALKTD